AREERRTLLVEPADGRARVRQVHDQRERREALGVRALVEQRDRGLVRIDGRDAAAAARRGQRELAGVGAEVEHRTAALESGLDERALGGQRPLAVGALLLVGG